MLLQVKKEICPVNRDELSPLDTAPVPEEGLKICGLFVHSCQLVIHMLWIFNCLCTSEYCEHKAVISSCNSSVEKFHSRTTKSK